jgi:hypothetical protein
MPGNPSDKKGPRSLYRRRKYRDMWFMSKAGMPEYDGIMDPKKGRAGMVFRRGGGCGRTGARWLFGGEAAAA